MMKRIAWQWNVRERFHETADKIDVNSKALAEGAPVLFSCCCGRVPGTGDGGGGGGKLFLFAVEGRYQQQQPSNPESGVK